jgi:hypothetical protein
MHKFYEQFRAKYLNEHGTVNFGHPDLQRGLWEMQEAARIEQQKDLANNIVSAIILRK